MKVKDFLTKKNWIKGRLYTNNMNKCCLVGAILICSSDVVADIDKIMKKMGFKYESEISKWNDDKKRKFEDVKKLVEELDI